MKRRDITTNLQWSSTRLIQTYSTDISALEGHVVLLKGTNMISVKDQDYFEIFGSP